MKTLADRVQWILSTYQISGRELSRRSGLNEVHIGQFLARARKRPDAEMDTPTLRTIASAAGVSFDWLASGEGEPHAELTPRVPRSQSPGESQDDAIVGRTAGWAANRHRQYAEMANASLVAIGAAQAVFGGVTASGDAIASTANLSERDLHGIRMLLSLIKERVPLVALVRRVEHGISENRMTFASIADLMQIVSILHGEVSMFSNVVTLISDDYDDEAVEVEAIKSASDYVGRDVLQSIKST